MNVIVAKKIKEIVNNQPICFDIFIFILYVLLFIRKIWTKLIVIIWSTEIYYVNIFVIKKFRWNFFQLCPNLSAYQYEDRSLSIKIKSSWYNSYCLTGVNLANAETDITFVLTTSRVSQVVKVECLEEQEIYWYLCFAYLCWRRYPLWEQWVSLEF